MQLVSSQLARLAMPRWDATPCVVGEYLCAECRAQPRSTASGFIVRTNSSLRARNFALMLGSDWFAPAPGTSLARGAGVCTKLNPLHRARDPVQVPAVGGSK